MIEYDDDEVQEPRKNTAQNYYAGYYWGNEPYDSYELPGRKNYSELKGDILKRLRANNNNVLTLDSITISVHNGIIVLTGPVKTYREHRLIGQEVWRASGVVKVLNELEVTEPEIAGPSRILQEWG